MTAGPKTLQRADGDGGAILPDAATDYRSLARRLLSAATPMYIFPEIHGTDAVEVETIKARPGWGTVEA